MSFDGPEWAVSASASGPKSLGKQPKTDDDLPLLDRLLTGDMQAFEELVRHHKLRVYRTTFAITGNAEDAEEAMQDAFMKAYQHLGEFQRASKFSTWLTRIAVNEGLQKVRRRKLTISLDDEATYEHAIMPKQLEDWRDNPEKLFTKEQTREIVESAIQSLPTIYREVFVLRDVQGLSTEEAGEALGVSIANVKSRLLRARLAMREFLAAHFQRRPTFKSKLMKVRWKIQDVLAISMRRTSEKKEGM